MKKIKIVFSIFLTIIIVVIIIIVSNYFNCAIPTKVSLVEGFVFSIIYIPIVDRSLRGKRITYLGLFVFLLKLIITLLLIIIVIERIKNVLIYPNFFENIIIPTRRMSALYFSIGFILGKTYYDFYFKKIIDPRKKKEV